MAGIVEYEVAEGETPPSIDYGLAYRVLSQLLAQVDDGDERVEITVNPEFLQAINVLSTAYICLEPLYEQGRHPDVLDLTTSLGYHHEAKRVEGEGPVFGVLMQRGLANAKHIIRRCALIQNNVKTVSIAKLELQQALFLLRFQEQVMATRHTISKLPPGFLDIKT